MFESHGNQEVPDPDSSFEKAERPFSGSGGLLGLFERLTEMKADSRMLKGSSGIYDTSQLAAGIMQVCKAVNHWKSSSSQAERLSKLNDRRMRKEVTDEEYDILRLQALTYVPIEDFPETRQLTRTNGFRDAVVESIAKANTEDLTAPINIPPEAMDLYLELMKKA